MMSSGMIAIVKLKAMSSGMDAISRIVSCLINFFMNVIVNMFFKCLIVFHRLNFNCVIGISYFVVR